MKKETQLRKITFTTRMLEIAEFKAKSLGLNFNEYIRHLITKDTVSLEGRFDIIEIEDFKILEEALDERRYIKFKALSNKQHFKRLVENFKLELTSWHKEKVGAD